MRGPVHEVMPGDLEPRAAIAAADIATRLIVAGYSNSAREAAVAACDIIDATCDELCVRANAARRAAEIARGAVAKGGDS